MCRLIVRLGAVALLCVAAGTACSRQSAAPSATPEPTLTAVPQLRSAADVTLPLDAFTQTPEQRALDYQANDLLVARCMRRGGAQWQGNADERARDISRYIEATNAARFGLVDEAVAAQYGYHKRPGLTLSEIGGGKSGVTPSKECAAEAKLTLGKDAPSPDDFALAFRLRDEAEARVQKDHRYVDMLEQWRACMRRAGFRYATPGAAAEDPKWQTQSPSTAELATAAADVRCKQETNYLGLTVALRVAYEQQLMEGNAEALQRLKVYYEERSRRVLAVLNGAGA